ncbi:MAG: metallophosphoesterase [Clostridia bacterium]|nr:metallophosphoesterase [Clostridia bacterium]
MKKILSVFLSVMLALSCCTLFASAADADDSMTFAVASDLHFAYTRTEAFDIYTPDSELFWYANRRAQMEDESGFIIDEFLRQCAENDDVEFVLLSGDLVDDGKADITQHYGVAAKLKAFEAETGKPVYVINGNHDAAIHENCATTFDQFKEIYWQFGYDEALTVRQSDCSYVADLNDEYRLIALDSCHETASTEDGMTTDKVEWVVAQAEKAVEDGKHPILMMHHNLLDHLPAQRILSRNFIVKYHYTTATLFANAGIKMVFSGHEHCSDVADYTTPNGNTIYDFATTSLTMYPLTYRVITCTDDEITYKAETVNSIDTAALNEASGGQYTDAMLAAMNEGMNEYGLGYLKTGVQYRLELSLSMEKMGISEDAIYYNLVKTAVDMLTGLLEKPLYGEDSVQELAKEYNLVIPDSDYENLWDLAMTLVSMHYAGEENVDLYSPEVTILLRSVAMILKDVLAGVQDEVIFGWANDYMDNVGEDGMVTEVTKLCTETFGGVTAVEYFLCAIASPILYEFAFDSDGVNDNNGSIEGYGTENEKSLLENVADWFSNLISKIKLYIQMFFSIFSKANVM